MPRASKTRGSSTPGRQKNSNCQKSQLKNQYCKDARWYKKDPVNYAKAAEHINSYKGNLQSAWTKEIIRG